MIRTNDSEKTILYYPSIKIKDGTWLRNAILYWDNVASIVPNSDYDESNSIEVEYLRSIGIYTPIYPMEMTNNQELCDLFVGEVKEKLRNCRKQPHKENDCEKGIVRIHNDKMAIKERKMLHMDKTPLSILDFLREEGLVHNNGDGSWLNMEARDADIYMALLAKYLAKTHGNTEIGTDCAGKFYYPYTNVRAKQNMESQLYLDVFLQDILPVPSMDVAIQDIVEFRMQHPYELRCFRRRIERFRHEIKWCASDVNEMQYRAECFQREIDEDLQEIEKLLKSENIRFSFRSLRSLIPLVTEAGIDWATLKGELSTYQAYAVKSLVNVSSKIFSCKAPQISKITESNAYLFYARKNEMIRKSRYIGKL